MKNTGSYQPKSGNWSHQTRNLMILVCAMITLSASADTTPSTKPVAGLRENRPSVYALRGAKIVVGPNRVIDAGTLVIRNGVIEAIGENVKPPDDARVIEMKGKTLYPGLIDAYSETSVPAPTGGARYWNALIMPERNIAQHYKPDTAVNKQYRSQGVTARLVAPAGGIIKGTSSLVTTGDQDAAHSILKREVAQHAKLSVRRSSSRDRYPNSPMGAYTLVRQSFYDADWYRKAQQAYQVDHTLKRPEQNDSLQALLPYRDATRLMIIDTTDEMYALRADRISREFTLKTILRGSGREYRRLDAIVATGRSIIVPVNFSKAPDVGSPEAAISVTLERLLEWDIAPENASRLVAAGVEIALTSNGLTKKSEFLPAIRKAVRRGLSPEDALRALTVTPAKLFGVSDRLGTLEVGKAASLAVTDGPLFEKKTKIIATWVDGKRYRVAEKESPIDVRGVWRVRLKSSPLKADLLVRISGSREKLTGTIELASNQDEKNRIKLSKIGLKHNQLAFSFPGEKFLTNKGVLRASAVVIRGKDLKLSWTGTALLADGKSYVLVAEIGPAGNKKSDKKTSGKKAAGKKDNKDASKKDSGPRRALYQPNYPLGAYGRETAQTQPEVLFFKNATVWTCGKQGIVKNASVLVKKGKIIAVGTDLKPSAGAVIVDAAGMHITPGIIDCHSHIATNGGVNEATQSITAEVRIGDFIDCNDINIYRQLAGGVTSSNILHGSANPIGGQNQVIKMRWGATPEQIKFAGAPQGIKFALGENVKQSNWGDDYKTRYPQSRMGVEQIMFDALVAAQQYREDWQKWNRDHKGMPPRVDLELKALAEILAGKRWIHCHSYRQDEILALMRTLELFKVKIGTFQHILEGYKIADEMAQHGAMGSTFSDWWAYKFEVYDAIPYAGSLMHNAGVVVSFNSDDAELGRRLNLEAAKAVKYGRVPPVEALKFVTLNPAKQLRIDNQVGSIEPGKDADLVLWSGPPLSIYSRCQQTWIDGRKYFDRDEDLKIRERDRKMRAALVQRILTSGAEMLKPAEKDPKSSQLWPRQDIFCGAHANDYGQQLGRRMKLDVRRQKYFER